MKVVVAIDSFKGSMTSMEAGRAAKQGVLHAVPNAQVIVRPLADEITVVMEMAEASGITLVGTQKHPLHATTYGVGEMIKDAIQKGCRHFIIGIGEECNKRWWYWYAAGSWL